MQSYNRAALQHKSKVQSYNTDLKWRGTVHCYSEGLIIRFIAVHLQYSEWPAVHPTSPHLLGAAGENGFTCLNCAESFMQWLLCIRGLPINSKLVNKLIPPIFLFVLLCWFLMVNNLRNCWIVYFDSSKEGFWFTECNSKNISSLQSIISENIKKNRPKWSKMVKMAKKYHFGLIFLICSETVLCREQRFFVLYSVHQNPSFELSKPTIQQFFRFFTINHKPLNVVDNLKEKLFRNQHDKTYTKMGGSSLLTNFGFIGSPLLCIGHLYAVFNVQPNCAVLSVHWETTLCSAVQCSAVKMSFFRAPTSIYNQ